MININQQTDILKKAIEQGIINIDEVQSMVDDMNRKQILQKHEYDIWLATDSRWKTYIKKDGKRKLIAKATKEKVEDFLVDYYETKDKKDVVTLRSLYPIWLQFKYLHTNSGMYIKRIDSDWRKYYEKDTIIDIPIQSLTKNHLDEWVHSMIKKHNMTKKQYYNMSVIIRQMFEYAMDEELIDTNQFRKIKVNNKILRRTKKKEDSTQVFLTDEKPKIINACWEDYRNGYHNTQYSTSLAIAFAFQTGLRVGEVVALRFEDINGNYLHVNSSEVRDISIEDGIIVDNGVKVVDYTKTCSGERDVYLTTQARTIIKEVQKFNLKYGLYDDGFIFLSPKNKRMTELTVVDKIQKICKKAHVPNKSMHKIRKTYVSTLLANGVSLNEVRKQAGHSDERTTLANYCYDVCTDKETEMQFENAL